MAKFGNGKPMDEQAVSILRQRLDLSSRHAAKQALGIEGSRGTGKIHSLRTFEKYAECLKLAGEWMRKEHRLRHLDQMTPAWAQEYLEYRVAEGIGQKQLDADRNALEFVTGHDSLERVHAAAQNTLATRSYERDQIDRVMRAQDERNALATRIAFEAGLRGHEILTLRRADEEKPSGHRNWRGERFLGREGERYIVTGKGGLKREVLLSKATTEWLESFRLESPREVEDRGIRYHQVYDINGGNRWSSSFGAASQRALGWSTGAHGLRHSYAKERMWELCKNLGYRYDEAREIVSQELGHFRGEIVETYLR